MHTQYALSGLGIPTATEIEDWAKAAIGASAHAREQLDAELTVRIVDEHEGAALNQAYRQRSGATNVLSFPFTPPMNPLFGADVQNYLGDLVICAPVVAREAYAQGKDLTAHWAHMVVHGSLHLLGYDHNDDDQAKAMEALEINILISIGYANPYLDTDDV